MSPCAASFSDLLNGAIITFYDTKPSLDTVEPRKVWRNENQLYPDRFRKSSNAKGMLKYHGVQYKDDADIKENPSMIRQSGCCCLSLPYERN